jgi:hypothetical protein
MLTSISTPTVMAMPFSAGLLSNSNFSHLFRGAGAGGEGAGGCDVVLAATVLFPAADGTVADVSLLAALAGGGDAIAGTACCNCRERHRVTPLPVRKAWVLSERNARSLKTS